MERHRADRGGSLGVGPWRRPWLARVGGGGDGRQSSRSDCRPRRGEGRGSDNGSAPTARSAMRCGATSSRFVNPSRCGTVSRSMQARWMTGDG